MKTASELTVQGKRLYITQTKPQNKLLNIKVLGNFAICNSDSYTPLGSAAQKLRIFCNVSLMKSPSKAVSHSKAQMLSTVGEEHTQVIQTTI